MNPNLPKLASSELLILIRGDKKTGKTSLLKRMSGRPFTEQYEPSTITQTTTIKWRPDNNSGSAVSITLLDVVSMNPRLTTTAHGTPQGIIVIYDPRESNSVNYAVQLIENTPSNIPIALLTNFQDVITADLHPLLRPFTDRCYAISSSMCTNLGLSELSHWLQLPLSLNVYQAYKKLLDHTNREVTRLKSMFAPGNVNRVINLNVIKDEDDGFWSDDDKNPIQMFTKPKSQASNMLPEIQQIPELTDNTGPIDKDDELMSAIIQTASNQKTIIGKDEIEYEKSGLKSQANPQMQQISQNIQLTPTPSSERKRHKHSSRNPGEKRRHHHKSSKKDESATQISNPNLNMNQQYGTQIQPSSSQNAVQLSPSEQARQMRLHALGYHTTVPVSSINQQNQKLQQQQQQPQQAPQPNISGYDSI
ncbi:Rab-like protein 6 [Tritrichomonas musculus]|uniref:Rab-like protein 6 n=1 Tax=Tritrichomonas musculus TaxID=1915356 RepID=A0ABR2HUF1_9EUKA